jgi:Hemerythrin HHE cation binding domain
MTDQIPAQAGPPLADTTDMVQVHRVFREAIASAPAYVAGASSRGTDGIELVAAYYANVFRFLHSHHEGEDEIVWPALYERAPDDAERVAEIAAQHKDVLTTLEAAEAQVTTWQASGAPADGDAMVTAVDALGSALLPHLDQEEAFIVPLAAQHMTAPEWGQLPSHGMRSFDGDRLWLILGLVREQMRPDQIAIMEAHMPPPLLEMWNATGSNQFEKFITDVRSLG